MKIKAGMVIQTPGMLLRVDRITGTHCKMSCQKNGEWRERGVTENCKKLIDGINEGKYSIIGMATEERI